MHPRALFFSQSFRSYSPLKWQSSLHTVPRPTTFASPSCSRKSIPFVEKFTSVLPLKPRAFSGTAIRISRNFSTKDLQRSAPSAEAPESDVINFYEESAKDGDAEAQFKLGFLYAKDIFEDNEVALLEVEEAHRELAKLAEAQRQPQQFDFRKWLRLERKRLRQAAAQRVLELAPAQQQQQRPAEASAGSCEGRSSPLIEAALWWFQCAAKQGHVAANHWLGVLYERAFGLLDRAVPHWQAAADAHFGPAMFTLGSYLVQGHGMPRDAARGLDLLRRGADTYAPCAFWYGYVQHVSAPEHGLARNDPTAITYIRKAAEMGDANAQHYLAMALASGEGVPRDVRAAREWLERAAERGHADALYVLACEFAAASDSSPEDRAAAGYELHLPRARQLFAEAGRLGHVEAMCAFGAMLYRGLGGPVDLERAFYVYQNAALRDHVGAARNLADLFERGEGVPASPESAGFWRRRAEDLERKQRGNT